MLTAFFLIDWLASINRIVVTLSLTALMLAGLLSVTALPRLVAPRRRLAVVAASVIAAALTLAAVRTPSVSEPIPFMSGGMRILYKRDTPYHNILVIERRGGVRDLLFNRTMQSRYTVGDSWQSGLGQRGATPGRRSDHDRRLRSGRHAASRPLRVR